MNNRYILIVLFVLSVFKLNAQKIDDVTLIVSGTGVTKEEATMNALRSAIEQTYGTFVSANTQLLNDELVKDEIVTVSSGNIKKYDEVAYSTLTNGLHSVTLYATVSISKLINYAHSKGTTVVEVNGALISNNIKLKALYEKNKKIAIDNMIAQLSEIPNLFDLKLSLSFDRFENNHIIDGEIHLKYNANTELFNQIMINTLVPLMVREKHDEAIWTCEGHPNWWFWSGRGRDIEDLFKKQLAKMRIAIKANTGETIDFGKWNESWYDNQFSTRITTFLINGEKQTDPKGIESASNLHGNFELWSDILTALWSMIKISNTRKGLSWKYIGKLCRQGDDIGTLYFRFSIHPDNIGKYTNFEVSNLNDQ